MTEWPDVLMGAGLMGGLAWILWQNVRALRQEERGPDQRLDAKNEQAHAGITDNVKTLRSGQDAIARDVPFLASRQAERDQQGARGADGTAR